MFTDMFWFSVEQHDPMESQYKMAILQPHSFVDLKNADESWSTAWVLDLTEKEVQLLQENSRQAWVSVLSDRIAPFRSYSIGSFSPAFSKLWPLSDAGLRQFLATVEEAKERGIAEPFRLTQFFRGELVHRLYGALQRCCQCDTGEMKLLAEFVVGPCIELTAHWLLALKTTYYHFYSAQSNPESFLVDSCAAYALVYREMSLCLKSLLGDEKSTLPGLQRLSELVPDAKRRSGALGFSQGCLDVYFKLGLFEAVLSLVTDATEPIPLEILSYLPLPALCRYSQKGFTPELKSALFERLATMSEKDVKEYDPSTIKRIITMISDLARLLRTDETLSLRTLELDISFKLFKSSLLEKRIRGLKEIKDILEETTRSSISSWWESRSLDTEKVISMLVEQKFFEVLIGEHAHTELLKRSVPILNLLISRRKLTNEQLIALWLSTHGRHESYVQVVYNIVGDLPTHLSFADTKELFEYVIRECPQRDEKYLHLLKTFSLAAMNTEVASRKKANPYAATQLFKWGLEETDEKALAILVRLMKECPSETLRENLIFEAIQMLLKDTAVPQILNLLLPLLRERRASVVGDFFRSTMKYAPMPALAINSVKRYVETARALNITSDVVTLQNTLHSRHLSLRLQLLSLLSRSGIKTRLSDVEQLWTCLVSAPVLESDADLLFSWLLDQIKTEDIQASDVLRLFDSKTFSMEKASPQSFETFRTLFLSANESRQTLEVRGENIVKRRLPDLLGFDGTLLFAIEAKKAVVNAAASALIADCMTLIDASMDIHGVWMKFMKDMRCFLGDRNPHRVANALRLCKSLIECRVEVPEWQSAAIRISIQLSYPTDGNEKISLRGDTPLGYFRKQVAAKLQVHPSKIVLRNSNRIFDTTEDSFPVSKVFQFDFFITVEIRSSVFDNVRPKEYLSADTMHECLLKLAAKHDTSLLAWDLLMKLPISKSFRLKLERMDTEALRPPSPQTLHQSLYSLIVISELCSKSAYADRFSSSCEGQRLIKGFFELNVLDLACSGELVRKFTIVVCKLITKLFEKQIRIIPTSLLLHQSLNLLFRLSQKLTEDCEEAINEVQELLEISYCGTQDLLYVSCFATHPKLNELLLNTLLRTEIRAVRKKTSDFIIVLCKPPFGLGEILLYKLLGLLPEALHERNSYFFHRTVCKLLKDSSTHFHERLSVAFVQIFSSLASRRESAQEQDEGLTGSFHLIRRIVCALDIIPNAESLQHLVKECLFSTSAICKHPRTRRSALKLLADITPRYDADIITDLLSFLSALFLHPSWRTSRPVDWAITQNLDEKSLSGYTGIRNTGCICYMISVIQQLFMVPSFRVQLLSLEISPDEQTEHSVSYACQRVFVRLMASEKRSIGIEKLCKALEKSVDLNEQMDVEEFLNAFLSHLESDLGPNKSVITNHFAGQLATETLGKESCTHRTERVEPFLTLPVVVKSKRDLYESLNSLVAGETMEGENAYQCDQCASRVTAKRRVGIHHLPNMLLLALRRFEYDLDTMQRRKLNDYYEFPWELDMEPYTLEGLHRRDGGSTASTESDLPRDYYQYRLRGVVIHMGSADGGHYYSFIQDRCSEKWLEFNDSLVHEIDQGDIFAEAFGGVEQMKVRSAWGDVKIETAEKTCSAYLLLYERQGKYAARDWHRTELQPLVLPETIAEAESTRVELEDMNKKNHKRWSLRFAFSHEFSDFVLNILRNASDRLVQFATVYFLTVVCRSADRYALQSFYPMLEKALRNNAVLCSWLLETVSTAQVVLELLVACPHSVIRRLVVGLCKTAVQWADVTQCAKSLGLVLLLLPCIKEYRQVTHYFELIFLLAKNAPNAGGWPLAHWLISYVLDQRIEIDLEPESASSENQLLGYRDYHAPGEQFRTAASCSSIGGLMGTLAIVPLTNEQESTLLSPEFLAEAFRNLEGKSAARYTAMLFTRLAKEDISRSHQLIDVLLSLFGKGTAETKKLSLRVMFSLLALCDSVRSSRVNYALSALTQKMKASRDHRDKSIIELIGMAIYKSCERNEEVAGWVMTNNYSFSWLGEWSGHRLSSRSCQNTLDFKVEDKLHTLAFGVVRTNEKWNSDDDVDFKTSSMLKRFNVTSESWDYLKVTDDLGEVAKTQLESKVKTVWVESDEEHLRPY